MIQQKINQLSTVAHFCFKILTVCLMAGIVAACTADPVMPTLQLPWRTAWQGNVATFASPPALWTDGTQTLLAWADEPGRSGLQWAVLDKPGQSITPIDLALGRTPRDLMLAPAQDGLMHLLWLDETLPDEVHLLETLVRPDGHVDHAPVTVSNKPTSTYGILSLSDGSLLTLWIEANHQSTLYAQGVDGLGRPYGTVFLGNNASFPSAARDQAGNLHLAWLEAQSPHLWTIHYLTITDSAILDFITDVNTPPNIPVGVISLNVTQTIGSFSIATDASRIYCLWIALTPSSGSAQGVRGTLNGLSFPLTDDNAVKALSLEGSGLQDPGLSGVRSLYVPNTATQALAIGALLSTWNGQPSQPWTISPAAIPITPSGAGAPLPVFASPSNDVFGDVAMAFDPGGGLVLAWTTLHPNGKSTLTVASTR